METGRGERDARHGQGPTQPANHADRGTERTPEPPGKKNGDRDGAPETETHAEEQNRFVPASLSRN